MPHALGDLRWLGAGHLLPAAIPGRLQAVLLSSGLIPDPAKGLQSREGEWAALREWTLAGRVDLSDSAAERLLLCGRGVRGAGRVLINGQDAGPFAQGDFDMEITGLAVGRDMAEVGLVFSPSLPSGNPPGIRVGVDGALFLRGVSQMRIMDWQVTPHIVDGYGVLESRVTALPYVPGRYTFRYAAVYGEEVLAAEEFTEKVAAAETSLSHRVIVPIPKRWQAGEENEPILVRLTISRAGLVCDDRLLTTGFREASFAESPAMQLTLSGRRVFLHGAEWAGCEDASLPGDEMGHRLSLLSGAHINCLRVYGLETDAFYDALDRRGFLLYQVLPADEEAARAIVRRVRHRPSLIAYGMESVYMAFNRPADSLHPKVRMVRDIVDACGGGRPFFGPIPGGPVAQPGRDDLGRGRCVDVLGPVQYIGPEALCRDMNLDDALIRTIACPAPALNLAALTGGESFWPPKGPLWAHRAEKMPDLPALREWFDADLKDAPSACRLLRALQAETVRYAVEQARMRGARASGVFVRDVFECAPALYGTALWDGEGPRPAYFALESALRSLHGCARLDSMGYYCGTSFEAKLGLLCDTPVLGPLTVRGRLHLPDGAVLAEACFDAEPETAELGFLAATLPDHPCALTLRVTVERLGQVLDVNDYTVCVALHALLWPMAHAPFASVRLADGEIRNDCDTTALCVSCGDWKGPEYPGYGTLLPLEKRSVRQEIAIEGLNLEPVQ